MMSHLIEMISGKNIELFRPMLKKLTSDSMAKTPNPKGEILKRIAMPTGGSARVYLPKTWRGCEIECKNLGKAKEEKEG